MKAAAARRLELSMLALICSGQAVLAQAPAPTPAAMPAAATANPVVWSAKEMYLRGEKNILAAADEMPADKYSFHPTPDQRSFGWIVSHLAASNGTLCGMLSDNTAPTTVKVPESASKPELVAALKASFNFCDASMDKLTDAKLGDQISFFRGSKAPRARALMEITGDLSDHYSQMASYLRASGLLPPSAPQPKK